MSNRSHIFSAKNHPFPLCIILNFSTGEKQGLGPYLFCLIFQSLVFELATDWHSLTILKFFKLVELCCSCFRLTIQFLGFFYFFSFMQFSLLKIFLFFFFCFSLISLVSLLEFNYFLVSLIWKWAILLKVKKSFWKIKRLWSSEGNEIVN